MQGKILDYNNEFKSGLIRGEDGNKYRFSIDDCKSTIKPKSGAEVDFEHNDDKAIEIYVVTRDTVDEMKDIATSAINATASAATTSKSAFKKIVPYAILIGLVIILVSLIAIGNDKYHDYQYEEARKQEESKIKHDSEKAHLLFANKQYEEALLLYTDLNNRSNENIFKFMLVECLIKLNNPIRAEAMLEKVNISDTFTDADGEQYSQNVTDTDKAKFYILKAKINKLNNDYKSSSSIYDIDYYSYNAEEACKYGDCSLIAK